jgi:outer membrane receptor protein involved in Fe transport
VSLFYNHSNNVGQPGLNQRILPHQNPPPPPSGVTNDVGVMLTFLEGRAFIRTTAFQTYQEGATGVSLNQAANRIWIPHNRILDALLAAQHITPDQYAASILGEDGVLVGLADVRNKGIETSVSLNLSRNITSMFNFSYTKVNRSNIMPEVDGWMEEARKVWTATPASGSLVTATGATVSAEAAEVARLTEKVRDFYGFGYGERPYKANATARYTFSEGMMKGTFVGGGVRWQSKPKLGRRVASYAPDSSPIFGETVYGAEDFKMDAFVGHRRRVAFAGLSSRLTIQLNVRNLTNEDEPMPLRYNAQFTGYSRLILQEPRSYRLSLGFDF